MFATLLGSLPRPPLPADAEPEAVLVAVVRAQEVAGLEPISDAGFGIGDSVVERWRSTSAITDRPVKQVLLGPYSKGREAVGVTGAVLDEATVTAAETIRADLLALASAGCPFIEIHEPAATRIGTDEVERQRFREAHRRLLAGVAGTHLSLAITGGNADAAGVETLLAAPYASLAVDLIAGPENWRLVVATPGELGIVCGAVSPVADADDRPEILLWAAGYAASTGGRGSTRVGLASASSMAHLPWDVAVRKLGVLGEAARLADLPPAERRLHLDPRSVDIRSAALGRVEPARRLPRHRRRRP
jgi:methionine synthase II (cobalamin-independent)